eukprot:1346762-Alexandrium_andersonii.AAC.1
MTCAGAQSLCTPMQPPCRSACEYGSSSHACVCALQQFARRAGVARAEAEKDKNAQLQEVIGAQSEEK